MAADTSAIQASIKSHVTSAIGSTDWNIQDGAPRGYSTPQCNIWWAGIAVVPPPMELAEVPYLWTVRLMAQSQSDPEQQDIVAAAYEAIYDQWVNVDAISCGGNCQLAYPSSVRAVEIETDGNNYYGIDITFTVLVKTARVFT